MKRLMSILTFLGIVLAVQAMDERTERINAIKKSKDFLYGEATMPTAEEAADEAYTALQIELKTWASLQADVIRQHVDSLRPASIADTVMTRRADCYRVFAFVKKSALTPVAKPAQVKVVPKPKDSLITDSVKQKIRERLLKKAPLPNRALQIICQAKTFFELKEILVPLKEQGLIKDYGKYATAQHPELCHLIIYDAAGNIRAVLDKGQQQRQNLKTHKADSIDNYRGCGAIWFILEEG